MRILRVVEMLVVCRVVFQCFFWCCMCVDWLYSAAQVDMRRHRNGMLGFEKGCTGTTRQQHSFENSFSVFDEACAHLGICVSFELGIACLSGSIAASSKHQLSPLGTKWQ